jgi:type I restriction enzyme S subunit
MIHTWPKLRLKFAVDKIGSGKTPLGGATTYVSSGVMLLRSQNIHFDGLRLADVVFIDEDTDAQMASTRVQPDDVLLNITGASLGRCTIAPKNISRANVNQHVCILRPNKKHIEPRFLNMALQSAPVQYAIFTGENGSSREGLTFEQVGNFAIVLPPLPYQQAIAAYLDQETARLDGLVAAKERLLGLLAEKRRELITRAVTRGLDLGVPVRDSGIPWVGEIPAHWDTSKFSWSVFIAEGQVDPEVEPYLSMLLVAPNHIESSTGNLTSRETAAEQAAISGKYLCRAGDVIYSKIRPALRKATLAPEECLCSADMYPLRTHERLDAEYLLFFLLSEPFSTWAVLESDRVAMPKINRETLHDVRLPVPPRSEQRAIVAHIATETAKIDALRSATERTITLLKERRTALIAAAVTGQVEVPEVV